RYSEPGKTAADTWLLLGRYPADANLYQWASYYFEEMQMFDEAYQLEKNAGYNAINGHWLVLQKALDAIRRGNLDEAETLLKNISMESSMKSGWEIPANLGLIKESQLSFTEALEYYETASSLCGNNKDQALIQLNIARCHRAMGNPEEAIRVLQYAQELDPDNLHVRLEMRKLQNPQL
ncbi:MAG: tetratricopeptide repeat protein, partial [Treponema sp.]|nr:tetratricopeptide repeat protein [Treponema sp.]